MKQAETFALNRLPGEVQEIWPRLAELPPHCILYGSSAIALRLDHEQAPASLEFKTARQLSSEELGGMGFLRGAAIQERQGAFLARVPTSRGPVDLTFEHGSRLGEIHPPSRSPENGLAIASMEDLSASKILDAATRNRAEDVKDITAVAERAIPLSEMLGGARAVTFGSIDTATLADRIRDLPGLPSILKTEALIAKDYPDRVTLHSQNLAMGLDRAERNLTPANELSENAKQPSLQLNLRRWLLEQTHELDGK